MEKSKEGKVRVNINLDIEILRYIDEYSKKNGISRSGAISVLIAQNKASIEGLSTIQNLMQEYQKQVAEGTLGKIPIMIPGMK